MFDRLGETIVAVSTPPGKGQRGAVRLSGPVALGIAAQLFRPTDGSDLRTCTRNARLRGRAALAGERYLLPAELFIFRAPRSYTREEVVEIHTCAAPAVLVLLVDRAIEFGACAAQAGEFTARAFYHGALDLSEVEGVAALIQARSDQQLRAAHDWLDGTLAGRIREVQEKLIDLTALVEADIDFAEEPIDFIQPQVLEQRLRVILEDLTELRRQSDSSAWIDSLPRVMLLGPPNAGKSTLMNRLSGMDRAVCSPIPGTTRDLLSAVVQTPEGEIEVIDSAGIGKKTQNSEDFSKNFLFREISHVELVCHVLDLTCPPLYEQVLGVAHERGHGLLWVANKADKRTPAQVRGAVLEFEKRMGSSPCITSALRGDGVTDLLEAFAEALFRKRNSVGGQRLAMSSRHREATAEAITALRSAQEWCVRSQQMIDCAEWVAFDLRQAADALGSLLGTVTAEELLGRIFERFCIGK